MHNNDYTISAYTIYNLIIHNVQRKDDFIAVNFVNIYCRLIKLISIKFYRYHTVQM